MEKKPYIKTEGDIILYGKHFFCKLFFGDMAHYTMVKNTHFNGIRPPAIAVSNIASGELELCKNFEYEDYKNRLS